MGCNIIIFENMNLYHFGWFICVKSRCVYSSNIYCLHTKGQLVASKTRVCISSLAKRHSRPPTLLTLIEK